MSLTDIKNRYIELTNLLSKYDHHYYNAEPLISDDEFDMLYRESLEIEKSHPEFINENSRSVRVGAVTISNTKQHIKPMFSLTKGYTEVEITKFRKRIQRHTKQYELLIQPKLDGNAISLVYHGGKLISAITRGDGINGSDITDLFVHIEPELLSITEVIDSTDPNQYLVISGEIVISQENYEIVDNLKTELNETRYVNKRSTVTGILNSRDIRYADLLSFVAYDADYIPEISEDSTVQRLHKLESIGFKIVSSFAMTLNLNTSIPLSNIDTVLFDMTSELIYKCQEDNIYAVDGAVLKIDSVKLKDQLGYGASSPNWAIAIKRDRFTAQSKLVDVISSVNRFGILTPVAVIKPVTLNSTVISRLPLSNFNIVEQLNLHINDTLFVVLRGDTIPKLSFVKKEGKGEKIICPRYCPACGTELLKGNVEVICPGKNCPDRFKEQLKYILSLDCLNVPIKLRNDVKRVISEEGIENLNDLFINRSVTDNDPIFNNLMQILNDAKLDTQLRTVCMQSLTPSICKKISADEKAVHAVCEVIDLCIIGDVENAIKEFLSIKHMKESEAINVISELTDSSDKIALLKFIISNWIIVNGSLSEI